MKKLLSIVTLLVLLVGSVFAENWVKYGTYENEDAGAYVVYFDYDATEPYDIEKESLMYFLLLQTNYRKVDVHWLSADAYNNPWCMVGARHNCYSTIEAYEDYITIDRVNKDGTITEYICWKNKEE